MWKGMVQKVKKTIAGHVGELSSLELMRFIREGVDGKIIKGKDGG